jgi:hypothetical protein
MWTFGIVCVKQVSDRVERLRARVRERERERARASGRTSVCESEGPTNMSEKAKKILLPSAFLL